MPFKIDCSRLKRAARFGLCLKTTVALSIFSVFSVSAMGAPLIKFEVFGPAGFATYTFLDELQDESRDLFNVPEWRQCIAPDGSISIEQFERQIVATAMRKSGDALGFVLAGDLGELDTYPTCGSGQRAQESRLEFDLRPGSGGRSSLGGWSVSYEKEAFQ